MKRSRACLLLVAAVFMSAAPRRARASEVLGQTLALAQAHPDVRAAIDLQIGRIAALAQSPQPALPELPASSLIAQDQAARLVAALAAHPEVVAAERPALVVAFGAPQARALESASINLKEKAAGDRELATRLAEIRSTIDLADERGLGDLNSSLAALNAAFDRSRDARAARDSIWSQRILPSAYTTLPTSSGGWKNVVRTLLTMGKTFDTDSDALAPGRRGFKLFHPFGSVLKIQFHGREGHPFTGVLADRDVAGLMRLSLGAPEKSGTFVAGVALKLFIQGASSVNALLLGPGGVEGHMPDKNFFLGSFTNVLPKPRRWAMKIASFVLGLFNRGNALFIPVDHFAARRADGSASAPRQAPYELVLRPVSGIGNPSDTKKDFRQELAALPLGRIFEVLASAGPGAPLVLIGDIEAISSPVASEYGDKGLFFRHRRGRPK